VREVSAPELLDQIERGVAPAIVDVRSRAEYEQGHVPGAIHMPFASLLFGRAPVPLDKDQPVVVYCGHGPRARLAAAGLHRRGFIDVRLLAGHMAGWERAKHRQSTIDNR
jgi:rhodanese-related sulfurtransferase